MKSNSKKSHNTNVDLNVGVYMKYHERIFSVEAMQPKEPNDSKTEHVYEDALALIGFGKTQWVVLWATGLLMMMVINETVGLNIITIAAKCDFQMNSIDKAVLSAASFVGILCSSYFWGYFSDTIGRRPILLYTTLAGSFVSLMSVFVPFYWLFVFLRFIVGLFIAGAASTVYAYLGEFFTSPLRPLAINYASMFVGIAMVYTPAVSWLVLSMDWSLTISNDGLTLRPWRVLIVFSLLPGLIGTLILSYLPESPKFLLSVQKEEDAFNVLNWVSKFNTSKSLYEFGVYKLKSETPLGRYSSVASTRCAFLRNMWEETRPLFRRPYVCNFMYSCLVMFGIFFSSNGMGIWFPEIQNRLGISDSENYETICVVIHSSFKQSQNSSDTICDDTVTKKSLSDSLWIGGAFVGGFIVLGVIVKFFGRKVVIVGGLCIAFLCGMVLQWMLEPFLIVINFGLFLILPSLCISVLSGAVVDLVPTHLRGKAVCICLMLGRFGGIVGQLIIGVLLDSHCSLTFYTFAGIVLASAALTLLIPI